VLDGNPIEKYGICKGSSILARLAYSFFHASIPHALINCWCLLCIVFTYDIPLSSLILAYITAVTFPIDTLSSVFSGFPAEIPTVGLSAVCFSLLGQVAFQVRRKRLFHTWVLSFIALGFIIPPCLVRCGIAAAAPNNLLNIYCYVAGLLVGFLNSPAHERK
jgi:membrane associated rhomboid family serine protease